MNSLHELNLPGQAILAVTANVLVNAPVHPLCTLKSRQMAKQMLLSGSGFARYASLYNGYTALCLTESMSYGICLLTNGYLQGCHFSALSAALLTAAASAPVITIGEEVMIKAQVDSTTQKLSLLQKIRSAVRLSSLMATTFREIPCCIAIFAAAPKMQSRMSFSTDLANNAAAGAITGIFAGALTAPVDTMKTRIQAHGISFSTAWSELVRELATLAGRKEMCGSIAFRALYIGITVATLNIANNHLPLVLPSMCFKQKS